MIRSYTINELEQLTAFNRRTISDYITKGLLSGPSHRGRGAVYSQRDLNVLKIIPRLRTYLKEEYGSLRAVAGFLSRLSVPDIQLLANKRAERPFVVEVRRLRVRMSLAALMPQVSPERFDEVLDQLSPEQICSVDAGRLQIGAVIDLGHLFAHERAVTAMDAVPAPAGPAVIDARPAERASAIDETDQLRALVETTALAASELTAGANNLAAERDSSRGSSHESVMVEQSSAGFAEDTRRLLAMKLDEIASRLDRVERMLEYETD